MPLAATFGITGALWYRERGELPGQDAVSGAAGGVSSILSSEIEDVEVDGSTLRIEFADDATADGWALMHESRDRIEDAKHVGEVPDFGGEVTLDLPDTIQREDFPSWEFEIVLYQGESGFSFIAEEEVERTSIEIPPEATRRTAVSG